METCNENFLPIKTITTLNEEIEVPKGLALKFQVELYADSMDSFKFSHKYVLNFKFGFNNEFYIDIPISSIKFKRRL